MDRNSMPIEILKLSVRSKGVLHRNGIRNVGDLLDLTEDELLNMRNLGRIGFQEIKLKLAEDVMYEEEGAAGDTAVKASIIGYSADNEYGKMIKEYFLRNDNSIKSMCLSNRAMNALTAAGFNNFSDIVFLCEEDIANLPKIGAKTAAEIKNAISLYYAEHEVRVKAWIGLDDIEFPDEYIEECIMGLYRDAGFTGYSLREIKERLDLPDSVDESKIKRALGRLIASNELEYVDYRCYRIFPRFADWYKESDRINDRSKEFIARRLNGETLESIGDSENITRERVRQILKKDIQEVKNEYFAKTGLKYFDEDYYGYLYSTYEFDRKEGSEWLGIPEYVWRYFELCDIKRGKGDIQNAVGDHENIAAGLRIKIRNFNNRNKIRIGNEWVNKKRMDVEKCLIRKFCKDPIPFEEFCALYNDYLEKKKIPEELYITDQVVRTREIRISESRNVLWAFKKVMRYYDIDGTDFTELLDVLNLGAYENIEISTAKLFEDNPEIMARYDIRDYYELHNLLRKIIPEGSMHGFSCGRMPNIQFGTFDRDSAIFDLLIDNAPVSADDLADIIHAEYGYDQATIKATYLVPFGAYYEDGIYYIDQKWMPNDRREILSSVLTENLYYIDEIKEKYRKLFPNGDLDEVNPYNLKEMGFLVRSRYAFKNYTSIDALCEDLLTSKDIVDIEYYRKRFVYIQAFNIKLNELKRNKTIVEFEPNKIISMKKLESGGLTKEKISRYCDDVYEFVDEKEYFTVHSLRKNRFDSDLFDFGFSEFFYAGLLAADPRFSYTTMFGKIVLFKGEEDITIKSFLISIINEYKIVDMYDLISELENIYRLKIEMKSDITTKLKDTDIYYDAMLDRFYADKELYYAELEE